MVNGGPGQAALFEAARQKRGKIVFHFGSFEGKRITRVAKCIKAPGQNPLWWLEVVAVFEDGDYEVAWVFYGGYNAHDRKGMLWYAGENRTKVKGEENTVMSIDGDLLFAQPPWEGHNVN
jgi:hypothetical protein